MKLPISKFTVNGNSMFPTLKPGQDILSFNWAYLGKKPKVGDIVIVKYGDKELVKRVQEVLGEQVYIEGDNKDGSTDSREFGPVNIKNVVGKVVYQSSKIPCPNCGTLVVGIYGRKDAICKNCGFKLSCCGEP